MYEYVPTRIAHERYYLNQDHHDAYRKLWNAKNKTAIKARGRTRYAKEKKEGLMMASTRKLNLESLEV